MAETKTHISAMVSTVKTIRFAKSDSLTVLLSNHRSELEKLNINLMAAPAPNNEKTSPSQGAVPSNISRYLPNKTPINTDAAMVIPIWEK
jgi:hypothetical protein